MACGRRGRTSGAVLRSGIGAEAGGADGDGIGGGEFKLKQGRSGRSRLAVRMVRISPPSDSTRSRSVAP
jgi:hypothetical protein